MLYPSALSAVFQVDARAAPFGHQVAALTVWLPCESVNPEGLNVILIPAGPSDSEVPGIPSLDIANVPPAEPANLPELPPSKATFHPGSSER